MKDRELEKQIRKTEEFMELWGKFRGIYDRFTRGIPYPGMDEKDFLETRELVSFRFEDLMDTLGVKPLTRHLKNSFVYDILGLETLSFMSDEGSKKMERNWKDSGDFLNGTLARLERHKKRLGSFNKFFVMSKKMLKGR